MSRPSGPGHAVQDPRPRGHQAAQGALLLGTTRRRVRAEDGAGSVCLPRGPGPEKGRRQIEKEVGEVGSDRLLRREAGIQVIATTAPDLPPVPNVHAPFARDHEYKRHGTLSLLAGIDLLTGKVYALVRDRHRSREFIEFLKLLDAAYPASTAIKLILDNHSAHISRETRAWLDTRPAGRFDFTFTPKHGSWLNLIEASSPSLPAPSCVTSAWLQNTNSRNASWPASTTSIVIQSSTPGPISSPRLPDMIRTMETLT